MNYNFDRGRRFVLPQIHFQLEILPAVLQLQLPLVSRPQAEPAALPDPPRFMITIDSSVTPTSCTRGTITLLFPGAKHHARADTRLWTRPTHRTSLLNIPAIWPHKVLWFDNLITKRIGLSLHATNVYCRIPQAWGTLYGYLPRGASYSPSQKCNK